MKKISIFQAACLLSSFIILHGCSKTELEPQAATEEEATQVAGRSAANENGNLIIITGAGAYDRGGISTSGEDAGQWVPALAHFSINAMQKKDGSIKGQLRVQEFTTDVTGEIECINVYSSDAAIVSGTFTKVKSTQYPDSYYVGGKFAFSFRILEGARVPAIVSGIEPTREEVLCVPNSFLIRNLYPVAKGNLQIVKQ